MDPPPDAHWSYARELLTELGAVDGKGRITAHGRELVRMPASPRHAHMLMLAKRAGLGDTELTPLRDAARQRQE